MSRSLLTRLAVAAGCLAPAAAAAEDVVWLRPGAPPPPDRPPAVVEDRPPTLPPVVRVEARAEPAPVRVEPTTSRPGLLPSPRKRRRFT